MADVILLEDGTSELLLEDGTGGLLLEDSPPPTPPPSYATWQAGIITTPSGSGTVAVTGLGGTPAAVFFFGTNWTTEDTAVTSTGTGIFRGMAAPDYSNPGTIIQSAATVVPAGDAHHTNNNAGAILQLDTSGGLSFLYGGVVSSFDGDGFTVNFPGGSTAGHKVVYVALMHVANVGGYIGTNANLALGFKAGASLLHGAWAGPDIGGSDRTQEYWGGAAYPGSSSSTWEGAGLTAFAFPTSTGTQYATAVYNNLPTVAVCQGGEFIGPALSTANVLAYPNGTGLEDFQITFTNANGGMLVAWDDEDSSTGLIATPAQDTDDTVVVSGLPFAPGLVIGYSISDEPPGQGSFDGAGARGAVGFSVATTDFQWCAMVDGVSSRGAFQSFQRGFADTVNGSNVHAGTIELTADGFILTTEEDSATAHDWVWHAFGHPDRIVAWIPHIYRRVMGT